MRRAIAASRWIRRTSTSRRRKATSSRSSVAARASKLWRQKGLAHRGLSAPVVHGRRRRRGGLQGLRALARQDAPVRSRPARKRAVTRVSNPPIASGDRVFVINDEGKRDARSRASPIALAAARSPPKAAPPEATLKAAPAPAAPHVAGRRRRASRSNGRAAAGLRAPAPAAAPAVLNRPRPPSRRAALE